MMSDAAEGGRTDSSDNVGMPSMKPVEPPEGGYEPMPGPTVRDLNGIPVPYGRDVQTDARTMAEVDASGKNIADDRDLDDVGFLSDMNVTSLGTEKRRGGWDPLATPYGAPPHVVNTSGTRGADDIKPEGIGRDGSLP
jgi:hypothetical protein